MGKTPKKAAPGGDERNLYVRRQKATTATSKASESSSSENSNRAKLTGIQKRIPTVQGKNLKVKPSALGKVGANHPRVGRPLAYPPKDKKLLVALGKASTEKATSMQPESEEAKVKLKLSIQKESKQVIVHKDNGEETNTQEIVEQMVKEVIQADLECKQDNKDPSQEEEATIHEEKNGTEHTAHESKDTKESEECQLKLSLDGDDNSPTIVSEEKSPTKENSQDENKISPVQSLQEEIKNGTNEKDELQSESQSDTQSYSVDIVESVTSELSEVSENMSQSETQKEAPCDDINKDISSLHYDSSIMLKDVQIKLNDCLKDSVKPHESTPEESKDDEAETSTPSTNFKDSSFGRTLRNISGRHSLSRMRHVTLRDRLSPNNSLFVNTSNVSLQPDDSDFKILRYSTGMGDTFSTNGTPIEKKRKREIEQSSLTKKQKTESENSLLHTSINLLRGWRKPVQVSTPNIENQHKLSTRKYDLSGMDNQDDEPMIITGPVEGVKKWCNVM